MRIRNIILLALMTVNASVLIASAFSNDEKTTIETMVTGTLMQADTISYGFAEIDNGSRLNVWYVPKNIDQDTILSSLGFVLGQYVVLCNIYPDLSDMKLLVGTKNNVVGEMYCKKEWSNEVRMDAEKSYNSSDLGLIGLKVIETFNKTS
jgi:hypothetical protein